MTVEQIIMDAFLNSGPSREVMDRFQKASQPERRKILMEMGIHKSWLKDGGVFLTPDDFSENAA